jgi:hypothetical protein
MRKFQEFNIVPLIKNIKGKYFSKFFFQLLIFKIISSVPLWKVGPMNMNTFQRGILYSLDYFQINPNVKWIY